MAKKFDRSVENLGNIVGLEHVNVTVPDQITATLFYITGLGLTRDPYLVTGVVNMWVNAGRSQFHLPIGDAQVLRGRIGLVAPTLDALAGRLDAVAELLSGTKFAFERHDAGNEKWIDVTCPWGNRFRCHGPDARFGRMMLGLPYVEFDVPRGAAPGIARFYRDIFKAPATVDNTGDGNVACVQAGMGQSLRFRETDATLPDFDEHHIQIYVADFSGPHDRLSERGLVSREDNQHQYRFRDIVDPESGDALFTIEHEVRSMTHPLYARPMVNRNPDQSNQRYAPGHETISWAAPYSG